MSKVPISLGFLEIFRYIYVNRCQWWMTAWLTTRPKRNTAKVKQMAVAFSTYRTKGTDAAATRGTATSQWLPHHHPTYVFCLAIVVLSGVLKPTPVGSIPVGPSWTQLDPEIVARKLSCPPGRCFALAQNLHPMWQRQATLLWRCGDGAYFGTWL